jgi:hypothetical protein
MCRELRSMVAGLFHRCRPSTQGQSHVFAMGERHGQLLPLWLTYPCGQLMAIVHCIIIIKHTKFYSIATYQSSAL